MKPKRIKINKRFIGRRREIDRLSQIGKADENAIVVMYGRRRIGKTELLEQAGRIPIFWVEKKFTTETRRTKR